MLEEIRKLFLIDPIEKRIEDALLLEKSINNNKANALELAQGFIPLLESLSKNVESMEKYCELEKSDSIKHAEGLILLDRMRNKLAIAESEYFREIGQLRKSNSELEVKFNRFKKDKEAYNEFILKKENNSLDEGFLCVIDAFKKGYISKELFMKSVSSFSAKTKIKENTGKLYKEDIPIKDIKEVKDQVGDDFERDEFMPNLIKIFKKLNNIKTQEDNDKFFDRIKPQKLKLKDLIFVQKNVSMALVDKKIDEDDYSKPIDVFQVGKKMYLYDGNHRSIASIKEGENKIKAKILDMTNDINEDDEVKKSLFDEFVKSSEDIKKSSILGAYGDKVIDVLKGLLKRTKEVEKVDKDKSFDIVKKAYENGIIDKSTLLRAAKNYLEKAVYADNAENKRLKRVGKTYGGSKKEEDSKDESEKEEETEQPQNKEKMEAIENHAKKTDTKTLENTVENTDNEDLKEVAEKELEKRGEVGDKKEDTKEESNPKEILKKKSEEITAKYKEVVQEIMDDDFADPDKTDKLAAKQKEYSRYLRRVKEFEGTDRKEELSNAKELLGLKSEKEIKSLIGDGEVLDFKVDLEEGNVTVLTEDCYCERIIDKKNNNVEMIEFILNPDLEKGGGKGTKIFKDQLKQFKDKGFKTLTTHAAKSDTYNGYYTWSRLGYDIKQPRQKREFDELLSNSGDEEIKNVKSLPELMSFQKGRDFWKKNGFEFDAVFDMDDNSESMMILDNYSKKK